MGSYRSNHSKLGKNRFSLKWIYPFHKLFSISQRFDNMAYTINQLFHMGMFLVYMFTLYQATHLNIPMLNSAFVKFDPGQYKYLTVWGVVSHVFIVNKSIILDKFVFFNCELFCTRLLLFIVYGFYYYTFSALFQ